MAQPNRANRVFVRRIRKARDELGLSQADLARRAGLQQSALSHYESGTRRPSFTNLKRLCRALNVSADYLIGNSERPIVPDEPEDKLVLDLLHLSAGDRIVVRALVDSLIGREKSS